MHSSRLPPLLIVAVAVAWLGTARAILYEMYTCSPKGNYTNDSPYGKNLAELVSTLSTPDPATVRNWWFRSRTVGTGPDQASGLAMCYADSDAERCLNCLGTVSRIDEHRMPSCYHSRNVSFVGTDGCIIRYADAPFFGSGDRSGDRLIVPSPVQPADVASMKEARGRLLSQLAETAGYVALQFASGSQGYVDAFTGLRYVMYGFAQCTRDLTLSECTSCLDDHVAVTFSNPSVTNSTEAYLMGFSCYLTYQLDKAIDITGGRAPAPSPAPTVLV